SFAVARYLGVVHRSYGSFDARWEATARKLVAKHPELNGEPSRETPFVARTVPDAARALALVDNWARMGERTAPLSCEGAARAARSCSQAGALCSTRSYGISRSASLLIVASFNVHSAR